ncbi:MAG: PorT family protein [Muribaculaceae bacterium]|nr:PorT family protein [Muribaculaceae bacterium]
MKKNCCLLILMAVMLTSLSSSAQLRYGFRLGGSIARATLGDTPGLSVKNGSGFSGGLLLEWQLENCGFAPDIAVLYTRYSSRLIDETSGPASIGRNFIEVPVHLKYKFYLSATNNLVAPMVYTGPSLLFRLGKGNPEQAAGKSVQPGWDLGIGLDIINFIQISAGYRFGLGNALSQSAVPGVCLHSDGWNVSANIIFDF